MTSYPQVGGFSYGFCPPAVLPSAALLRSAKLTEALLYPLQTTHMLVGYQYTYTD